MRSQNLIRRRRISPTSVAEDGKIKGPPRNGSRRMMETKKNVIEIHGATDDNTLPAYEGLLLCLASAPVSDLHSLVLKLPKLIHKVLPKLVKNHVEEFENSMVNFIGSVKVLYRGGIASKAKFCQIRSSLIMDTKENEPGR